MKKKLMITIRTAEDAATVKESGAKILAEYPNAILVSGTEAQKSALEKKKLEVVEMADEMVKVGAASFKFGNAMAAEAAQPVSSDPSRTGYYLVKLVGPAKGSWLETLKAIGASLHGTLPGNALLVGVPPARLQQIGGHTWVEDVTPFRPTMKVSPKLRAEVGSAGSLTTKHLTDLALGEASDSRQVEINVFSGESSEAVAAQVRSAGGTVMSTSARSVTAVVPLNGLGKIADQQGVQSILPHRFPKLVNDRARPVMTVPDTNIFGDFTLRGAGQVVAIADSGLDTGNPAAIHADFTGRVASITSFPNQYSALCNDPAPFDDGTQDTHSAHGTHVAGSVLGNGAAATALSNPTVPKGVAPEAQVYFQAVEQQVTWKPAPPPGWPAGSPWPPPAVGLYGLPDDLHDLFGPAYTAGARVHTNSWGADDNGQYSQNSRDVDDFMFLHRDMLILFAAGNAGLDTDGNGVIDNDSIGSPSTAKNCLTIGASENNRPHGSSPAPGIDGNWIALSSGGSPVWPTLNPGAGHVSDNPDGMAAFSSRGPTDDGRIKPDVVAPGTNILSVRSSAFPTPNPLWGDLPVGHPLRGLYCWSGGTSMATPLVAGAVALIRQHLIEQRGHHVAGSKPSGALLKAFLVNGATPMPGQFLGEVGAGPNNVGGFGRVSLTEAIAPGLLKQALFADEPGYAVESGQMRTIDVQVINPAQPIKITLCWSDAPAPAGTGGLVNQLYLRVRRPDLTVVDADTTAFPTASNNVQQVVITAPAAGAYEIRVHGVNVSVHSPGAAAGPNPRQDFALVVSNAMGISLQPVSIAQTIDTTGSMDFFGFIAPARERANQLIISCGSTTRFQSRNFLSVRHYPTHERPIPFGYWAVLRRIGLTRTPRSTLWSRMA